MKYDKIKKARFIARPNRFIARVMVDGKEEMVHVKNTGRLKELLYEGVKVILEDHSNKMGSRKTRYSLIAVEKEVRLGKAGVCLELQDSGLERCFQYVNIDSQLPNKAVAEALISRTIKLPGLHSNLTVIKPEVSFGGSRFDFYLEGTQGEKAFIEVKGVTLEEEGVVRFPDAPTERGVKHVEELIKAVEQGFLAYVIFVIQMNGVLFFEPNDKTHLKFGQIVREAKDKGVHILAYECKVTEDSMVISKTVKVNV